MTPNEYLTIYIEEDKFTDWLFDKEQALAEASAILRAEREAEVSKEVNHESDNWPS